MSSSTDPFLFEQAAPAAESLPQIDGPSLRQFLAASATVAWAVALLCGIYGPHVDLWRRWLVVCNGATVALVLATAAWAAARHPSKARTLTTVAAWSVLAGLAVMAGALGTGVRCPALVVMSMVVCLVTVICGVARGGALAAGSVVAVGALAAMEYAGWPVPNLPASPPLAATLATVVLLIGLGWFAGQFVSAGIRPSVRSASHLAGRVKGLARMAIDWQWEQDAQFRYLGLHEQDGAPAGMTFDDWIGRAPWEIAGYGLDDEALDAHRADLESRRPFDGLIVARRNAAGRLRYLSLSGEPRYHDDGVFAGYWGIGIDVTQQTAAQHAAEQRESRYRQLFDCSPSPLIVHSGGRIVDANDAAVRTFGFSNAAGVIGREVAGLYAEGVSRQRMQDLTAQLDRMPAGSGIPVADFRMKAQSGRLIHVQATSVRVDSGEQTAILTMYFDVTARVKTEGALRRSEGMLSLLFATSPDCITLTEMTSGRYRLVNDSFARLTGYRSEEVVGHTGLEMGLWDDPNDLAELLDRLRREGRVDEMPAVFRGKHGKRISMLVSAARFTMDHHDYVVVNARDVTDAERVRLEHAAIFQRASVGIALIRDAQFVYANPRFEQIFGWPDGGLTGLPCSTLHTDAAAHELTMEASAPRLDRGLPFEVEREMRRYDGTVFSCRLMADVVDPAAPRRGGAIWIAEDVTSQRETAHALEAARDAAEAASRAKSAFLANTSHEIRTPLNGLLGMARLAMRDGIDEAIRRRHLQHILESAQGLSDIISDILDLSKIEAGKLALETVPFDLHAALETVYRGYLPLAEAKDLSLHLHIDALLPRNVRGDPMRVRQIVSNFISNALKFTEQGAVRLHAVNQANGAILLEVTDTGPGIPEATQQRLFTPFTQADDSTTRRFGGTGLGLSICRQLAEMMGGEVGLKSAPGAGSTFYAVLPLARSAEPPSDLQREADGGSVPSIAGIHVLLVEDNPVNMLIGAAMLEQWGVDVTQAVDGRLAVDAVHHADETGRPFDLVLMDVQMPVMSGYQATRQLRQRHTSAQLPIVALTAAALVSERQEAVDSGMDDFLTKPIDADRLFRTVAKYGLRRPTLRLT